MDKIIKVVLYARFSSNNQRTESIDAQVRAIRKYCQEKGYIIIRQYVDEAKSGTSSDKRPEFLRMIADSNKKEFEAIIVHKLDRFARNRFDSAIYRQKLKKNNVKLFSVLENLNDSPESIMLESLLEGMNEYFSRNLARECLKGLKENALRCWHTGGIPPLGYDVGEDKKLIVNVAEAEIVKSIFDLYDRGFAYTYILKYLNQKGYRTKRGNNFGKNSLSDLLRNRKYCGTFIYNRISSKSPTGTRNGHLVKEAGEVIEIPNGCPAIISVEQFRRVQKRLNNNVYHRGKGENEHFYLLTGKIFCGECGKRMCGTSRRGGATKSLNLLYRCPQVRNCGCNNREINAQYLDSYVKELIIQNFGNGKAIRDIKKNIQGYIDKLHKGKGKVKEELLDKQAELAQTIKRTVEIIQRGITSEEIFKELDVLTKQQNVINEEIANLEHLPEGNADEVVDEKYLLEGFERIQEENDELRYFYQQFIREIQVGLYSVEIVLKKGLGFNNDNSLDYHITISRKELYKKYHSATRKS